MSSLPLCFIASKLGKYYDVAACKQSSRCSSVSRDQNFDIMIFTVKHKDARKYVEVKKLL